MIRMQEKGRKLTKTQDNQEMEAGRTHIYGKEDWSEKEEEIGVSVYN